MRFSLTLLALLASLLAYGQAHLQPIQLVNTLKNEKTDFKEAPLFRAAQQSTHRAFQQLGSADFQVLELEEENLSLMLHEQPRAIELELPMPGRAKPLRLQLVQVDPLAEGFQAIAASSGQPIKLPTGVHYRGVAEGDEASIAAFSFFEGEAMGLVSLPGQGNFVLGKLEGQRHQGAHLFYNDRKVLNEMPFECGTEDEASDYRPEQLNPLPASRSTDVCVGVYLEIDYDVVQSKGGSAGAANYMAGLFNQVATLYANEQLNIRLSELYLWDVVGPYGGNSSFSLLTQFVNYRPTFNGDLGQLISYQASGGVAYLSGLCSTYSPRHGFSSINPSYTEVPTYSYSVMVVAHELGHQFGSRHTHACAWNGNNTAIDGCPNYTEGNCSIPGLPSGGGTIMSYCHISSAGINFSKGFGPQPGNVMRFAVANASCLGVCQGGGSDDDDDEGCQDHKVTLTLVLDAYGGETTWEVRDTAGSVLHQGGPYPNTSNGSLITEEMCLKEDCYVFEIRDTYGDGICCAFGQGSYTLTDTSGLVLATGGEFGRKEEAQFCVPAEAAEPNSSDCETIDFMAEDIRSFGGPQDAGSYNLLNEGEVLRIQNNAWKAIAMDYEIKPGTVLEFDFGSTRLGEVHGIGFDENLSISSNRTFRLHGMQNWGISDFNDYEGGAVWQHFSIPVGEYYTGDFKYLFFVADHDRLPRNGNSFFRNIVIYDEEGCGQPVEGLTSALVALDAPASNMNVFPNPTSGALTLHFDSPLAGQVSIQVFSITGQALMAKTLEWMPGAFNEQLELGHLPAGTYVLKAQSGTQQWVERVILR